MHLPQTPSSTQPRGNLVFLAIASLRCCAPPPFPTERGCHGHTCQWSRESPQPCSCTESQCGRTSLVSIWRHLHGVRTQLSLGTAVHSLSSRSGISISNIFLKVASQKNCKTRYMLGPHLETYPLGGIFNMWSFSCWKNIIRVLKICFAWQKLTSSTYTTWDNTDGWEGQHFRHINQRYLSWELWYSTTLILRGWRKQIFWVAPELLSGLIPLLNQSTDS